MGLSRRTSFAISPGLDILYTLGQVPPLAVYVHMRWETFPDTPWDPRERPPLAPALPRSKSPAAGTGSDTRARHTSAAPANRSGETPRLTLGAGPRLAGGGRAGPRHAWCCAAVAAGAPARGAQVVAAVLGSLSLRPRWLRPAAAWRCVTGAAMASRKGSRGAGGSPSPGSKRETKHGGGKNGRKEGLSGSSFFTWFMVIALLGVWTSVAVVWFELVDYEEVLGKLGIYDADGDGDFDVEDAKLLLGLKETSVPAQPISAASEEAIQPAEQSYVESEHKNADLELEEEIQSVLREALHSQPGERHEDVDESVNDQGKEEIHGETLEATTTDDLVTELENELPEAYETPDSVQKDADLSEDELEAVEPEPYEAPVSYEYSIDVENTLSDPEAPGHSELMLEDAVEHYAEDRVHSNYNEDHEPKHEEQTEPQDTAVEDLLEDVNEATEPEEISEDFDIGKDLSESEHTEDLVATEPEASEVPVQAENYSNDNLVDT